MVCNYKFSSRLSAAVSISNNWLENVPVFKIAGLFASNCLILAHPKHCYTVMPKMTATIGSTLRFQEKKNNRKEMLQYCRIFFLLLILPQKHIPRMRLVHSCVNYTTFKCKHVLAFICSTAALLCS